MTAKNKRRATAKKSEAKTKPARKIAAATRPIFINMAYRDPIQIDLPLNRLK